MEMWEILASHFARQFADEQGKRLLGISHGALAALVRYPWPGNVRELRNAMEGAVALEEGDYVTPAALPRVNSGGMQKTQIFRIELRKRPFPRKGCSWIRFSPGWSGTFY